MSTTRIDRLLATMGYGSRREIQLLADAGRITLDGVEIDDADARITLSADLSTRMLIDGAPLDPLPGMVVLLHKPLGATCSHKEAGTLIYDLLPARWRRRDPALSSVGRLDKETSGLLLITDDGALLHRIISPKHHVAKRYRVTLDRPLNGTEEAALLSGTLMLEREEKPLLPVAMETHTPTNVTVTLHEGRYHQVRRMFAALGNHVVALHRETVGGLHLPDDLAPGAYRLLDAAAIAQIFTPNKTA
ncbi:MAG: pseudouridine synthase [Pseudomonadota bacterium]